jgi:alkylhydroperoxidase family enzyme
MARIPYANFESDDATRALAEQIRRERGGKVLNLYRMLLHSPPVARGWLAMFTAIRQQSLLPGRYRELAILRVAVINDAEYEFTQHIPFAAKEGVSQAQLAALREGKVPDGFDMRDRAVLDYAEAMTREIRVPDEIFERVRDAFSEREIVELTATVAGYNLVSRFLEAMQIDHE